MTNKDELTPQQIEYVRRSIQDPVRFANRMLGVDLWEREVEILRAIQKFSRTAIKSCHGAGKTFALAVAALWWLARYADGIVLTLSPTFRQVRTQLWSEIHRLAAMARVPYPELNTTELMLRGNDNFALGFSTNKAAHLQGYHGQHILIIADEAPGIEENIWDAIAGIMAGGKVHIVAAGNPTIPSGAFYNAFHGERALWHCITVDALDTPNLKGICLQELLELDPTDGGPLDQNPIPYLLTKRWVRDQHLVWWHGDETSSPMWMSRVRGQFPNQSGNALIRLAWLERASAKAAVPKPIADHRGPLVAGIDVGGGGEAETVVYVCDVKTDHYRIVDMGAWRGEDTRGPVIAFLNQYRARLSSVRIDAIGVGHNFGLHLRDERFYPELINVSMPCESQPQLGENDPARRFVNLRAQFFQALADAFEHGQIDGLADDMTLGQLAGILYEIDPHGRLKIESKESARRRGVPSPDRADALMLALGKPPWKFEFYSTRDLHRSRKSGSIPHPFWGFTELGEDDGRDGQDPWTERVGKLRLPRGRVCW